jgi:hypothetical protein
MKVIVNKEQKDLTFSFEGNDYTFVAGKPAQVEDALFVHLQALVPLAFDFEPDLSKIKAVAKVQKKPTNNVFPGGKFGAPSANLTRVGFPNTEKVIDETPESGKTDKDGIGWYGPGLESDSP